MGSRVMDASVFIGNDDSTYTSTSTDYHYLTIWGDTVQLVTPWTPTSSGDNGNQGEIRWGSQTLLGVTTHYIYVCVATNTWKRVALNSF